MKPATLTPERIAQLARLGCTIRPVNSAQVYSASAQSAKTDIKRPRGHGFCLCGQPAVKRKFGMGVCASCDAREQVPKRKGGRPLKYERSTPAVTVIPENQTRNSPDKPLGSPTVGS
jgi:hypothetical protein